MPPITLRFLLAGLALLLIALPACSSDDGLPPRESSPGGGPLPPMTSNPSDNDPDADSDTDSDSEDVTDSNGPGCNLEPADSLYPDIQPCCFTHEDCWDSDAPDAQYMRCYEAGCSESGEGLCRLPPTGPDDCWSDADCDDDESCVDAFTGTCEEPLVGSEFQGVCN